MTYPSTRRAWLRAIGRELALAAFGVAGFSVAMWALGVALGVAP